MLRVGRNTIYALVAKNQIPQRLKAGSRELDPDRRIVAMLSERGSAWQHRGSRNEETPENLVALGG